MPTHGNWQGLSLGWTTVVWLAFILSEGDHRLDRVEPWVKAQQRTLSGGIAHKVRPRDLAADRLATILAYLSDAARWSAFERALNQSVLRVSDLQERLVRVDTTTAAAYVTPEGLCQLGHSKDHRPALPQVKLAMTVLDPLGLPLTTTVVAGNTANDPLYLPEIAKVRQIVGIPGLTYVGDCKRTRNKKVVVKHNVEGVRKPLLPWHRWCVVPIGFSLGRQRYFSSCLALLGALDGDTQQPFCYAPLAGRPALAAPARPTAPPCRPTVPAWRYSLASVEAPKAKRCTAAR